MAGGASLKIHRSADTDGPETGGDANLCSVKPRNRVVADGPEMGGDANHSFADGEAPVADGPEMGGPRLLPNQAVGLDMGVSDRIALSTGERIATRRADWSRRSLLQQRVSSAKRGSRTRRARVAVYGNFLDRERVRNRNQCHRITTALVRRFGVIVLEDLSISNMTRSAKGTEEEPGKNVSAKAGLNRSILEQTWGLMRQQLEYKAASAGRLVVAVDPRYTSQTCSRCGVIDAEARSGKVFACKSCGLGLDADINAARNILQRGRESSPGGKPQKCVRVTCATTRARPQVT